MPKSKNSDRLVRLSLIQHYLHKNPRGLSVKELAELCETTVRTIQRDMLVLQSDLHVPVINKGKYRYGLLKEYMLPPISYSLYENLELFLAARLIIRQTDGNNPHLKNALNKLASAMPKPLADHLKASIKIIKGDRVNRHELDVFEKLAIAWVTQKKVRILYQSARRNTSKEWILCPYFMEMTGVGSSVYVIGYAESDERKEITTFKLNRIKEVKMLDEEFKHPEDLNISGMLRSSWGVVWGDDVTVKLKFSSAVTRRVKESIWHPSQVLEDQPDGGCILTLRLGSTMEITPWIRGWGPDVEVLEPLELREQMKGWVKKLGEIYK